MQATGSPAVTLTLKPLASSDVPDRRIWMDERPCESLGCPTPPSTSGHNVESKIRRSREMGKLQATLALRSLADGRDAEARDQTAA
jgi:hypothetical protein